MIHGPHRSVPGPLGQRRSSSAAVACGSAPPSWRGWKARSQPRHEPETKNPRRAGRGTSTPLEGKPHLIASQQVSWWSVHEFVAALLDQANGWPMLGTPAWCSKANDDPQKWAALLDAAQHWALRLESCQEAECQASRDISAAADWSGIAQKIRQHNEFYAAKPWLKRVAS
jgi:hypothetical protein